MESHDFSRGIYALKYAYNNDSMQLDITNTRSYSITKSRGDYSCYAVCGIDVFIFILTKLQSDMYEFELTEAGDNINIIFQEGPLKITLILDEVMISENPELCEIISKIRTEYDIKMHRLETSMRDMITEFREAMRVKDAEIAALSRYVIINGTPIKCDIEQIVISPRLILTGEHQRARTVLDHIIHICEIPQIYIGSSGHQNYYHHYVLGDNFLDNSHKLTQSIITVDLNCNNILQLHNLKTIIFNNVTIINIMDLMDHQCEELYIYIYI